MPASNPWADSQVTFHLGRRRGNPPNTTMRKKSPISDRRRSPKQPARESRRSICRSPNRAFQAGIPKRRWPGAGRKSSIFFPLSELDQWVSANRLLEILWDEQSRPSLQWIRKETKRRMLPHIRRGRLIFYRPRSVIDWYNQRECRPSSMKGANVNASPRLFQGAGG